MIEKGREKKGGEKTKRNSLTDKETKREDTLTIHPN